MKTREVVFYSVILIPTIFAVGFCLGAANERKRIPWEPPEPLETEPLQKCERCGRYFNFWPDCPECSIKRDLSAPTVEVECSVCGRMFATEENWTSSICPKCKVREIRDMSDADLELYNAKRTDHRPPVIEIGRPELPAESAYRRAAVKYDTDRENMTDDDFRALGWELVESGIGWVDPNGPHFTDEQIRNGEDRDWRFQGGRWQRMDDADD